MCLKKLFNLFRRSPIEKSVEIQSEIDKVIEVPSDEPIQVKITGTVVTPELALASWLVELVEKGKFSKKYQLIEEFLEKSKVSERGLKGLVGGMMGTPKEDFTPLMKWFIKTYRIRRIKCLDEEFQNWITTVEF